MFVYGRYQTETHRHGPQGQSVAVLNNKLQSKKSVVTLFLDIFKNEDEANHETSNP